VTDSLAWRRFCRIGISDAVPHPTTLMKITTRCGEQAVDQLNEALLRKAMAAHVVKLDRVRATPPSFLPTSRIQRTRDCCRGRGQADQDGPGHPGARPGPPDTLSGPTRSVRRRAHQVAVWLRRRSGDAKEEVLALTGELARIADAAAKDAQFRGYKCPASVAAGR